MTKTQITKTLGVISALLLSSCAPSMVYNPAMNLTSGGTQPGAVQLYAGWGRLAETRPQAIHQTSTNGFNGGLRIGISDRVLFMLNGSFETDSVVSSTRGVASGGVLIDLAKDSTKVSTSLLARGGVSWVSGNLPSSGGGANVSIVFWLPRLNAFQVYCGLGPIIGFTGTDEDDPKSKWGWGIIGNLGLDTRLSSVVHLNGEVCGTYQNNKYEDQTDFILVPSIVITAVF